MSRPGLSEAAGAPGLAGAEFLWTPSVRAVFAALDRDGEAVRIVGGAVRNALLGQAVVEVDFATTALPDVVIARAEAAGLKAVPTGIEHGTVTVIAHGEPHEVTTLRHDVETDGRRAKVAFGRDWTQDARRRDFTMNALYLDAQGRIFDPLGGCPDVLARRVRFIGDPAMRIREDALRILRFFRFAATYGEGRLDLAGFAACLRERARLDRLSRERIRQELLKLLAAPHAVPVAATMAESGFLDRLLAGVPHVAPLRHMAEIEAALGQRADPLLRLAALGVVIVEDAERLAERLRLSNEERDRITGAAKAWRDIGPDLSDHAARAAIYRLTSRTFGDALTLAWARSRDAADDPRWHALARLAREWRPPRLPLAGRDVLALGIAKGPAVGEVLGRVEAWWIEAGFPDEPERIREALRRAVEDVRYL